MRLLRARSHAPTWLAVGVLGVGLLVGGAWYVSAHGLNASLLDDLTRRASAQEVPAPPQPPPPPAPTNSKRPMGEVAQITTDPASFTMRAPDGTLTTYRVLPTTVFMAGRDRPYHFDLLKTGDQVVVGGGGPGQVQDPTAPPAGPGIARPARRPALPSADDGEPIARLVIVRPAGEAGMRGRGAGAQNGGSHAAGQ